MHWAPYRSQPHNPVARTQATLMLPTLRPKVSPKPSPLVRQTSSLPLLPLPDRNITDGTTFSLSATASSSLAVTFESNDTNLLTISGTTATILDEGPLPSPHRRQGMTHSTLQVSRSFNLFKKDQTISDFAGIADTNTSVSSISLSATASSGLAVVWK